MRVEKPFETVVCDHGRTVLRVCRVIVGPVDADNAWSETFLSALKAYPDLAGDANVEAWLVTIAHHKAIDIIRARTHRALPTDHMPEPATTLQQNAHSDILETLDRLPHKQKHAVTYHYLAGLPYTEVAEIIGGTTAARRAAADGIAALRRATGTAPIPRDVTREGEPMNTNTNELIRDLARITDPTHDLLADLHRRLVADAQRDGVLDIAYRVVDSPVGALLLAATDQGLVRVAYAREGHDAVLQDLAGRVSPRILYAPERLDSTAHQLDEYFAGTRYTFDVELDWRLCAGFRSTVLHHLPEIGYGHTASYATVAELAGNPKAVRAVGTACATNPLPVVVPCHRVVRSDGALGGYLGGTEAKRLLLDLEAAA